MASDITIKNVCLDYSSYVMDFTETSLFRNRIVWVVRTYYKPPEARNAADKFFANPTKRCYHWQRISLHARLPRAKNLISFLSTKASMLERAHSQISHYIRAIYCRITWQLARSQCNSSTLFKQIFTQNFFLLAVIWFKCYMPLRERNWRWYHISRWALR